MKSPIQALVVSVSRCFSNLKVFLAGAILGLLFPPFSLPVVFIFIVFLPFLSSIYKTTWRVRFKAGLIFGFGFFVILLKWLNVVGLDALILLSLICSLWWAISATVSGIFQESKYWPLWFATTFTTFELLRDRFPFGGFGWGQLGTLLIDTPLYGLIGLVGQVGATFIVYLAVSGFYLLVISASSFKRKVIGSVSIAILSVLISTVTISAFEIKTSGEKFIDLVAVQGGVERTGLGTLGTPRAVLEKHIETTLTNLNAINNADLVIWPESSVDLDPFQDFKTMNMLLDLDEKVIPPLLIGTTIHDTAGNRINSSQLLQNGALTAVYEKRRLVPFGEFLPFREIVENYTNRASLLATDFVPGKRDGTISDSGINLGVLICFEVADDSLIHKGISENSATIIQTNNATYQHLGQSEQQVLYTRVRAVETNKSVISIATSGLSVIVNSHGEVEDSIKQDDTGIMQYRVYEQIGTSFATKFHTPVKLLIVLVFASGMLLRGFSRFRMRR